MSASVESVLRLAALLMAGYAFLCAALYLLQDHLIFLPRPLLFEPEGAHVQPAAVQRDAARLRGWVVNPRATGPLVIYFGGNAEELSPLVDVFARLDATTVLINYRGFGASDGSPAAAALIADARAVVRVMHERLGSGRRLILFGRSLGAGIAVEAAGAAPVDALVLMSPYRSLTELAQRKVPLVPVGWLLRHRIEPRGSIADLPPRVLVLYGVSDYVIPPEESRAFVDLLVPPPRVVRFEGSHNVPLTHPQLWPAIQRFIQGVEKDG